MSERMKWAKRLEKVGGILLLWSAMRSDGGAPLWEALVFGGGGSLLLILGAALSRSRKRRRALTVPRQRRGTAPSGALMDRAEGAA